MPFVGGDFFPECAAFQGIQNLTEHIQDKFQGLPYPQWQRGHIHDIGPIYQKIVFSKDSLCLAVSIPINVSFNDGKRKKGARIDLFDQDLLWLCVDTTARIKFVFPVGTRQVTPTDIGDYFIIDTSKHFCSLDLWKIGIIDTNGTIWLPPCHSYFVEIDDCFVGAGQTEDLKGTDSYRFSIFHPTDHEVFADSITIPIIDGEPTEWIILGEEKVNPSKISEAFIDLCSGTKALLNLKFEKAIIYLTQAQQTENETLLKAAKTNLSAAMRAKDFHESLGQ